VRHLVALTAALYFIALACCACAFALNPDRDIHQLAHRSWGEKEGYPGRTQALAQTTDGYLWLGSDFGLFRFDGVHFERYSPRSGDTRRVGSVTDLVALSDGSLWIAYRVGNQICDLRNDHLKCYGKPDGITSNPIAIVQDREGVIWANTETGIIRFDGTRWEHIGKAWNFPEDVPHSGSTALFVDSRGTLWVGINSTVLYLKHGSKRFETTGVFAGWSVSMAETPDGTIWLADNRSYIRAITTSVSAKSAFIARCEVKNLGSTPSNCPDQAPTVIKVSVPIRLLVDHNGSLWITTDTSGVFRVSRPERLSEGSISDAGEDLQSFSSKEGLSADNCTPVLEDREGNIWVATRDGLDQFRDNALVPVLLPTSFSRISIARADSGDIWVGSRAYVMRIYGDSGDTSFVRPGPFKPYSDPSGTAWLIGYSLEQWKRGSFHRVAKPPDGHYGGFGTWEVAGDNSGTLWAFYDGYGFFSFDHGRWKAWVTPSDVAKQKVTSIFSDSTGLIWVSTYEGHVITMDRGKVSDYPLRSDGTLRYAKAFAEHAPQQIWVGGAGGLALIDGGGFRPLIPLASESLKDITGIIDAGNDGLWLSAADGVFHVPKDEVDRALQDPSHRFKGERFDSSDGLPGKPSPYPFATVVQGTDGRIWFTATRGVAWIDPKKKTPRNAIPPPVHIERVVADGKEYEVSNNLQLPPHLRALSLDYTALSLAVPEKVHFKVKLEGQDNDWRELLNVRRVEYTNLPPHHYTFRVIACNNSGVWNDAGAALEFSVLPAFYQTNGFRVLCIFGFFALLWSIYRLRVEQMQRQFNIALDARVNERTRIARELHDTLLQNFHGLMFQFQAASRLMLRKPDEAKQSLDDAIGETKKALAESREAIQDLRSEPIAKGNLAELLMLTSRELAESSRNEHSPVFDLIEEGKRQALSSTVSDDVCRIALELMRNAYQHAHAQRIEVEMRYGDSMFRLRVRDDGRGIDPRTLREGGRAGHWGLRGLRERAERIGAHLDLWSEPGNGTEVQLLVPASIAFQISPAGYRAKSLRKVKHHV
jgi:signal transduction histidine kinase/ligand-binding sensor domain-containing protein